LFIWSSLEAGGSQGPSPKEFRDEVAANAALTLKPRERMARRVVDAGWSLTQAAAAAEVSDRTCAKSG